MNMWTAFGLTLRAVMADASARSSLIVAVVLYSFFYPLAYHHQVADQLPIAVVDQDHSALSRELIRNLSASKSITVTGWSPQIAAAEDAMWRLDAHAFVMIPAGFQRDVLRGTGGELAIYSNAASSIRNKTVLGGINAAVAATAAQAVSDNALWTGKPTQPPIRLIQRPLYNTREGYGSYVVPGVAELILQQTLIVGIVLLAGTRRESGWTGTTARGLAGIVAAFTLIGCINALYYFGFIFWFQDYPRGGNLAAMLLTTPLYILAVVCFALCIGSFFNVRERALQALLATSLPMFFLTGLPWPVEAMPRPLFWLGQFVPMTHGIATMLKFNQFGAGLGEAAADCLWLLGLAVLYGSIAFIRFVRRESPAQAITS
jgi:ABC-2 type transport system permease protein